jgi:hypothetical protein
MQCDATSHVSACVYSGFRSLRKQRFLGKPQFLIEFFSILEQKSQFLSW